MTNRNCTTRKLSKQPKRGKTNLISQDEFVRRCLEKHGDAYDYSKSKYINSYTNVEIVCKKCGKSFFQLPNNHWKGYRCTHCYAKRRFTIEQFIQKSKEVHGNTYDYSRVQYKNNATKVLIVCSNHGEFYQSAATHMKGVGCPKCATYSNARKARVSFAEFAKRSRDNHGGSYTYSKELYQGLDKKAGITCKKHGLFYQDAKAHMHGKGCRQCGFESSGFDRSRFKRVCKKNNDGRGLFYVIKCKLGKESFYKIGITSRSVKERYCSKGHLPYSYTTLYSIKDNADYIHKLEARVHVLLKEHHYTPRLEFKGSVYECFTTIKPVEKLLKELSTTEQLQLLA